MDKGTEHTLIKFADDRKLGEPAQWKTESGVRELWTDKNIGLE